MVGQQLIEAVDVKLAPDEVQQSFRAHRGLSTDPVLMGSINAVVQAGQAVVAYDPEVKILEGVTPDTVVISPDGVPLLANE